MKFNKLYIAVLFVMATLFVGCSEWEDTVTPSPTVPAGNPAVRFHAGNSTDILIIPAESTEFTLTVKRNGEQGALEVPVTVVTNTENSFAVPDKVLFAAGSPTATLTIVMTEGAPKGKDLPITLSFGDDVSNVYMPEYSTYYGSVYISDWEYYASGTFTSEFWASWAQDIEYSPVLDSYRFPGLITEGYLSGSFKFSEDGSGEPVSGAWETGYVHPTYGMISAEYKEVSYVSAEKTIQFTTYYFDPDGPWGNYGETFTFD